MPRACSLVAYLVELKGAKAFAAFLREAPRRGYAKALTTHYGFKDAAELQAKWLRHAVAARLSVADEPGCPYNVNLPATRRPERPDLSPLVRTLVIAVAAHRVPVRHLRTADAPGHRGGRPVGPDGRSRRPGPRGPMVDRRPSLWIAALCGGVFGLLGGWMIDRFGRQAVMVASILIYSLSPLAAAFSTELWQFVLVPLHHVHRRVRGDGGGRDLAGGAASRRSGRGRR